MEYQVTGVVTRSKAAGTEQRPGVDVAIVTRGKEDAACASSRSISNRLSHEALDHDNTCVPTIPRGEENASCLSGRSRSSRLSHEARRRRAAAVYKAEEELFKLREQLIRKRLALGIAEIEDEEADNNVGEWLGAGDVRGERVNVPPAPVASACACSIDGERADVPPATLVLAGACSTDDERVNLSPASPAPAGTRSTDCERVNVPPAPATPSGACSPDGECANVPLAPPAPAGTCSNDGEHADLPSTPPSLAGTRSTDNERVDVPPAPAAPSGTCSPDEECVDLPPAILALAGTRSTDVERVDGSPAPAAPPGTYSSDGEHVDLPPTPPALAGTCSNDREHEDLLPTPPALAGTCSNDGMIRGLAHAPHAVIGAHVSFAPTASFSPPSNSNRNRITAPANLASAFAARFRALARCQAQDSTRRRDPARRVHITNEEAASSNASLQASVCALYNSAGHRLSKCVKFVNKRENKKWNFAKDTKLCRKCFVITRARYKCRAKRRDRCRSVARATPPPPHLWAPQRRRLRPAYERCGTQAPLRRRRVGNEYG